MNIDLIERKDNSLRYIYQKTITFTYNGRPSYQSFVGGSLSVLVQIVVFIIMVLSTVTIFQRGKTSTSINTIAKDLTNDPESHYFTQKNQVYFAIKLIGPNPEKLLDKTYLNLQIQQIGFESNDTNEATSTSKIIDYELWGDKFPIVGNGISNRIGLSSFIWPKNSDFFIRSDLNSDNYQILQINISKWNEVGWKSDKEILDLLQNHTIYIALVDSQN